MKTRLSLALLLGLGAALLWACPSKHKQRSKAPKTSFYQLKLPLFGGTKLSFHEYYGKVVHVDFFATSCSRCELLILPMLKKLSKRYHSKGLRVVGVAVQPQAKQFLVPFLGILKLPYPVAIGTPELAAGRTVFGKSNLIPRGYLFDRCGKLKRFFIGPPKAKQLEGFIKGLLAQKPQCNKP